MIFVLLLVVLFVIIYVISYINKEYKNITLKSMLENIENKQNKIVENSAVNNISTTIEKNDSEATISVILVSPGRNVIHVLKEIRNITGCGLKEANNIINNVPSTIIKVSDSTEADRIRDRFSDLGAAIEIKF